MALNPGTRLGVYEITAQIGAGGMGEVYRAHDTKLKRPVAIKILPPSLAADRDRLARFQREAEVLASLNHPNIAAIYGLEESAGMTALVMELVEGDDLSQRIARGAIPIDDALPIAKQIAEALEAAHEQGIVHRDLKPANIKVKSDGMVKVLDFGLAKAMESAGSKLQDPAYALSQAPTITTPAMMTGVGMILGTAAYMSPEQARGKTVDRRADIWAFGCVLFEMLTGTRAFEGEDIADTLSNVMKVEPNWGRCLAPIPARVVQVMRACLQKNPKQRIDSAQGVRLALEGAFETAAAIPGPGATPAPARTSPWAVAVVALVAAGTLLVLWAPWRSAPTVSELRFQFPQRGNWFISPDGQRAALLYFGQPSIGIREMNDPEPRFLQSTRSLDAFVIWSPDSRSIAYQSRDFKLMKAALDGSPPIQLADLTALGGGSWSDDGVIIVGIRKGALQRVPATGGALTPVTTLAPGQREHALPQFIGGGRFLYVALGDKATSGIYAASLTDPNGRLVVPGEFGPSGRQTFAYVPPVSGVGDGYILYTVQNVLLAQAVDPSSLELTGSAAPIAKDAAWLSASLNGTLALGPEYGATSALFEWRWLDRTGKAIPDAKGATGGGVDATISPSGTRWARSLQGDIWVHGMGDGAPSRVTFESTDDRFFTWSPDDQWIAYATGSARAHDRILRLNTITPSTAATLVSGGTDLQANDWSRDGKFLLFADAGTSSGWDMWTLDLQAKDAKPVPYLQTPAGERNGAFSPDGRWIAYQSDESGQLEVYVQSFPAGAGKFQVSAGGGISPRWRADGRELYFRSDDRLMGVTIQTSPRFAAGVPQELFTSPAVSAGTVRTYDVTPNASRFLVAIPSTRERDVPSVTVIVNWPAGLKTAGGR